MIIEWVNHASYIIYYKDIALLCDPWIEGRVFNNSWDHLTPTKFTYSDFEKITHIWFSHEHPDHFFPPNLKKIPIEYREKICVLFHESIDKKVIEYCKKLNFKDIIELKDYKPYFLNSEIKIVNSRVENETDSWIYKEIGGVKILNLNDCVFSNNNVLKKIATNFPEIDILLTQFSYANWCGNFDQKELREKAAIDKINEICKQIEVFKPKHLIPFASFVFFCHENNFHMNDSINKIDYIIDFLKKKYSDLNTLVFLPGDTIEYKNFLNWNNVKSLKIYNECYNNIYSKILTKPQFVLLNDVFLSAENYLKKSIQFHKSKRIYNFKPMNIHLIDYDKNFKFDFKYGLVETNENNADIALTSDVLKYTFDLNWGFDTLLVSGLFQKPVNGNFENVKNYIFLGSLINNGEPFGNYFSSIKRRLKQWWKNK